MINFENSLIGKTAVVGGSTQGIGLQVAKGLAYMGASVVLLARNEEKLQSALKELDSSKGNSHHYFVIDYSNTAELTNVAKTIAEKFQINILVNNTGGPAGGPIVDAGPEAFLATFHQHLIANQLLAQAFLPAMIDSNYGRIINLISTSVKAPLKGLGVSNTIRGAVANWAKTWANEVGKYGITVNNVLPGATLTQRLHSILEAKAQKLGLTIEDIEEEMLAEIPMGRFAQASEIANAVMFLASPLASYINGINIPVDGGRTHSL